MSDIIDIPKFIDFIEKDYRKLKRSKTKDFIKILPKLRTISICASPQLLMGIATGFAEHPVNCPKNCILFKYFQFFT